MPLAAGAGSYVSSSGERARAGFDGDLAEGAGRADDGPPAGVAAVRGREHVGPQDGADDVLERLQHDGDLEPPLRTPERAVAHERDAGGVEPGLRALDDGPL